MTLPNMPKCRAPCYWRTWNKYVHKSGKRVLNPNVKPEGTCLIDIAHDENGKCTCFLSWEKELMVQRKPKSLIDIADMPNFDPAVKDGLHSVSEGKIFWTDNNLVTCKEHGACNALNKDLTIWRCLMCHEGAYVVWEKESEMKR